MKRWGSLGLGVLLVLVGAVWCLQGIGLLTGSPMTGQQMWFAIGLAVGLVGLAFLAAAVKYFRRSGTAEPDGNGGG